MKINIFSSHKTPVPASGEYIFIRNATGDVDVTFRLPGREQTVTMGQGETLHIAFESLEFQARGADQEIDVRMGFGRYTPPMSAITSSIIEQIQRPVDVTGSSVAVSSTVDVTGSAVEVSGTVDVTGSAVEVSGTVDVTSSVVSIDNLPAVQTVSDRDQQIVFADHTITAGSYVDIAARPGRQVIGIQVTGTDKTTCRISNPSAATAAGVRLIGGGDFVGWLELQTAAAVRVWSPDHDVDLSVMEAFA
ncbi:hypothetical protein [Oceanospirillum maris]|uniref:hypothetical protein n=1 Tax=Oceanospirillum maris TaxID=64977 RepID=UPI000411B38A|nr:hypothetical protein [Oceanospirillum maris]